MSIDHLFTFYKDGDTFLDMLAMDSRQPRRKDARRSIDTFFPDQQEQESNEFEFRLEDQLTPERVNDIVAVFTQLLEEVNAGKREMIIPNYISACFGSFPVLQERTRSLFTPKTFKKLMAQSGHIVIDGWPSSPTNTAFSRTLYTFFPNRASEFEGKSFLSQRQKEIQGHAKKNDLPSLYHACANFFLLFPERRNELPVNGDTHAQFNERIQEWRQKALQMDSRSLGLFFESASQATLLHLELKRELGLDARMSDLGKDSLKEFGSRGGGGYKPYLELLERMSILAAREVRVPSPGRLEFVFDEKPPRISAASPMPLPNEF